MTNDTIDRTETHATFVIERTYPSPVHDVWHALSDTGARAKWFGGGDAFDTREASHDFRVGGGGVEDGKWRDGPTSRFVSAYTDIVEDHRMVFTYDMFVDGRHLSTSITTIVVEPDGDATHLTHTEQAVHFDGLDSVEGREEGTRGLLDNLGRALAEG